MHDLPPPYIANIDLKYNGVHQQLLPGTVPEPSTPSVVVLPPAQAVTQQGQPIYNIVYTLSLGPLPVKLQCANCYKHMTTRCQPRAGLFTWLICGGLALIGFWPCCIIPFCIQSCHDIEHHCSLCNSFIGKYFRI